MVRGIDDLPLSGGWQQRGGDNWRGFQLCLLAFIEGALQRFARPGVRKIEAPRILSLRAEQISRQRDGRMRRASVFGRLLDGIGGEVFDGRFLVGKLMHEGAVGAVLQEPAHEIGEQRLMRADGRVNPAGPVQVSLANHMPVKRLAHAVQALELVIASLEIRPSHVMDGRQRMRVVGCELRENEVAPGEQPLGAGEVAHIRIGLVREHRIALKPVHLGALDLAIPIGALDEPDHQPPLGALRHRDEIVHGRGSALLIGLHHEAEPLPAPKRRIGRERFKQVERQLQAVRLLGIDIEADAVPAREHGEIEQTGIKFVPHPVCLHVAVARMKRRQFYRDARRAMDRGSALGRADRGDGVRVGGGVTLSVLGRYRRLAQHVE